MNQIQNNLLPFNKISLSDLDKVTLMNRVDQKFCLHLSKLPEILNKISSAYSILEINGETIFSYENTYFDTPDNEMFISHQNGKRNRYKVRMRKYVESQINFLEIKFKNNKGRTLKERIKKKEFKPEFNNQELGFLEKEIPFPAELLKPKINSFFNRFTLVDYQYTERVTVDIFLGFRNNEKEVFLNNLVIIEVKKSKAGHPALITKVLQELRIRNQGFSKYCIGRAMLEDDIKKNNFKRTLLRIKKEYPN